MRRAIVLAVLAVACRHPARVAPAPAPSEPPPPPPPPPPAEVVDRVPWDLYALYLQITEIDDAGTPGARDDGLCDWILPLSQAVTRLYDHADRGAVPAPDWRAALAALDESMGALERACEERTDVEGRFGELRFDVWSGIWLVLGQEPPRIER